jgi:hypothetical protein
MESGGQFQMPSKKMVIPKLFKPDAPETDQKAPTGFRPDPDEPTQTAPAGFRADPDEPTEYQKYTQPNIQTPDSLKGKPDLNVLNEIGGTVLGTPGALYNTVAHPYNSVVQPLDDLANQGKQEWNNGHKVMGAVHSAESGMPVIGPLANTIGQQISAGNYSGAVGTGIGAVAPAAFGEEAGDIAKNTVGGATKVAGRALQSKWVGPGIATAAGTLLGHALGGGAADFVGGLGGLGLGKAMEPWLRTLGQRMTVAGSGTLPAWLSGVRQVDPNGGPDLKGADINPDEPTKYNQQGTDNDGATNPKRQGMLDQYKADFKEQNPELTKYQPYAPMEKQLDLQRNLAEKMYQRPRDDAANAKAVLNTGAGAIRAGGVLPALGVQQNTTQAIPSLNDQNPYQVFNGQQ